MRARRSKSTWPTFRPEKADSRVRLAETVKKEMEDSRVIVMDLLPIHEEIAEFVNAGVAGFILKDATFEDFIGTIRSVADGARVLPPRMTGTLFSQIAQMAVRRGGAEALKAVRMTKREREVIAHIAVGMSNKEIAQDLNIATDTAKSHVRNVMEKLALHSRLQIAAYAHSQEYTTWNILHQPITENEQNYSGDAETPPVPA
jgi:DNA-binding NarL/FixJ family response regulator